MNSVYESLRALLRSKELEIKRLEKEIEALRIVLPIVAEAGTNVGDSEAAQHVAKFASEAVSKTKPFAVSDPDHPMAQAATGTTSSVPANIPAPDLTPKPRTNWP
jgi:hypothetical protein